MKHEEIDVIIPVYRPDEKLHRLLLALERQTVKPSRILLVNTERELFDDACLKGTEHVTMAERGIWRQKCCRARFCCFLRRMPSRQMTA